MSQATEKRKPQNSKRMQWITASAVFFLKIHVGILIGWNSPNISRLTGENSPIPITLDEASWLVSVMSLASVVAIFIGAAYFEFFGSKKTVILAVVTFSISYICLICASSVEMLYIFRALGGAASIFTYISFSIFVGEIATPQIRGTLISLSTAGYYAGVVFATITETYIQMKITGAMYLSMCIVTLILIMWLKNTPYYFISKKDYENAKRSIAFYHGDDDDEKIFKDAEKFVVAQRDYTCANKLRDFKSPVVIKSMILISILSMLPVLCGQSTIMSYIETILRDAKATLIDPKECVIYINVLTAVSSLLTVKLVDTFGRRIVLMISGLVLTVAMVAFGIHFYLLQANWKPENLQWLPYFSIIFYTQALCVGISPMGGTVLSELFTENLKSVAGLVVGLSISLVNFINAKAYQSIVDYAGQMYVFWMYAAFASLVIVPSVLFLMTETKGKSFQEIQEELTKK